jgi:glycosyltransferase involved in cell wall biosynthesis
MQPPDTGNGHPGGGLRILIVADNASARFGGEAFLPLHYFTRLRARGVPVWLVTHARVRDELLHALPEAAGHMHFVKDSALDVALFRVSGRLPRQVALATTGAVVQTETQLRQRHLVRALVRQLGIDVVHQPIPVSPRTPSAMWNVGAPVVIGPMNGGMTFPPAFRDREPWSDRLALTVGRGAASLANRLLPGKRGASLLLVANARTRLALPAALAGVPVEELVENGVDLKRFRASDSARGGPVDPSRLRAAFVGRLVDWKAVDILIDAIDRCRAGAARAVDLEVFGDGPMRTGLEAQVARLGLGDRVRFHGFVPQDEMPRHLQRAEVLVLPSLYECGGAVVLEAMALGLPVVATRWGGPADYLDDETGILIEPTSRESMVADIAGALRRLAAEPELGLALGRAARLKAESYDWELKVDRMLAIYLAASGLAASGLAASGLAASARDDASGRAPSGREASARAASGLGASDDPDAADRASGRDRVSVPSR